MYAPIDRAIKAASTLKRNAKKGFFLMVEGSRIDMAGHSNDVSSSRYMSPEWFKSDSTLRNAISIAGRPSLRHPGVPGDSSRCQGVCRPKQQGRASYRHDFG